MPCMSRRFTVCLLLFGLLQSAPAFEEQIRLIEGLTARGFPKLARTVLERTLKQYPEAADREPALRIRILIADKQFAEAQTQIAALGHPADLQRALADAAWAARRLKPAAAAYRRLFEQAEKADADLLQAAFNYGELLQEQGSGATARELYEKVLALPTGGSVAEKKLRRQALRPLKVRLAQQLLRAPDPPEQDLACARELSEDVQLGGLDLWFGQAVVTWSRVMQLQGDWDETRAVLETQLQLLKQLEDNLVRQGQPVSQTSPLAGARYLLGRCYEKAGQKADALTQFYNVYAKYGDSEWGPKAQEKAQALKDEFEAQGKTVKIDLGANLAKMQQSRFRVARRLFFDHQYAEAVPAYLDALNQYPEGSESLTALRELALSYIALDDALHAKAVAAYTGERFSENEAAANALLAAGKTALDKKQNELAWWMYDRYFEFFPKHDRAPAVLYSLAALRRQNGDEAAAAAMLKRILETYPESPYAPRARGRLAWSAYEAKDYPLAAERFEPYIETETDPEKQTRARFALGESYRFSKHWKKALQNFQTLEKSLVEAADSYGVSEETLTFNKPFIEKSMFYQGVCLAALGRTDAAVEAFDRFIERFQGSEFIEQARFAKGSALVDAERWADALAAFEPFDDSSDRRFLEPVLFYRGQAYTETGQNEKAIQSLETLLNRWPESAFFFEAKFVQGRAFAAAGQNEEAVRVLSDILSYATDDLLMHRASLALGRAQTDPAEKLASFQRVALLADPDDPEQAPFIAEALAASLPLYLELKRPDDLLTDSERLTAEFPMFGKPEDIALLKKKAEQMQRELTADNADGNGSKHEK